MTKALTRFLYGGDYNPDQWPEDTWSKDIRVFKKQILIQLQSIFFLGHCLNLKKVSIIFPS